MIHPIYKVTDFKIVAPHQLHVSFDDGTAQKINFRPILMGELFGPLADVELFNQVQLDDEAHTLVWPNGADLDPATLHDWPDLLPKLREMAQRWEKDLVPVSKED